MSRKSYAKSQVFLMEFIVVVLFFSLCASICISAFVKADNISKESQELNHALLLAQSAAETVKALNDDEFDKLSELVGVHEVDNNKYVGYYTKNFKRISPEITAQSVEISQDAIYVMEMTTAVQEQLLTADIIVYSTDAMEDKICELEVKKYLPEEV